MQARYYFDHNATTPLSDEVLKAFTSALQDVYGNASSIHQFGQDARQRLESARGEVAAMLGATAREVVLLSGGTEANNLALSGTAEPGSHFITTAIEHPAVLSPAKRLVEEGVEVTVVPPGADGQVDPDAIRRAMNPRTSLVSVMHANNETGVIQPVEEIARICRDAGALFHVDGVQTAGKIPVDVKALGVDFYSVSAHKIHGPKGIGALYVRRGVNLRAQILGGRHERERRAGTENVPAAVAFGYASRTGIDPRIAVLRDRLEQGILAAVPDARVNGGGVPRLPNTTNIAFEGVNAEAVVIALDLRGFAVSSGSACSSGAVEPSHVLLAMGQKAEQARSSVRFSLGRGNDESQVDALVEATAESVKKLRCISVSYSHV